MFRVGYSDGEFAKTERPRIDADDRLTEVAMPVVVRHFGDDFATNDLVCLSSESAALLDDSPWLVLSLRRRLEAAWRDAMVVIPTMEGLSLMRRIIPEC